MVFHLKYDDEDGTEMDREIEFRGWTRISDLCGFKYSMDSDPSVDVPWPVIARLMAALEAIHVLRPSRPVLSDDDPYAGDPDPFCAGDHCAPYWRIDPARNSWELELYSKIQPYIQYVAPTIDADVDVHLFNMCDGMRDTLLAIMHDVYVSKEASLESVRLC